MSGPSFSHDLRQRQTQSLVLAPQLRQSLKILQVAALDLRSVIQEELQANPTLEELPMEGESVEKPAETDAPNDTSTPGEHEDVAPPGDDSPTRDELDFTKQFEILGKIDEDWRDHFANVGGAQPFTAEDAEKRQHFFDSLVSETSLQEHLMQQVVLNDLAPPVHEALHQLIGNLDDRGYLAQSPSDIALQANLPYATVTEALKLLQSFDPPGIGSQTLADCLLAQLHAKGRGDTLAARMLRDHFELLSRRRIPELSRKLGVAADDVQAAIEEIGKLDPAPGRRFAEDSNRVVVPDVVVEKEGDEWKIHLNSDYIPRLRLSSTYRELIAKGTLSKEERDYLRERMRSGKFLIDSIEQRQRTIERITREIINAQLPFFEHGVSQLRPLTMTQIADVVGVHETTVSRAIANKYMKTPHGVFEFKYFFTTGYQAESGDSVSNTSVKEMLADLIALEDKSAPLSDQEIVAKLQEKGITLARRTVAKYREELGILPSNLRRDYK
ncbi:RNA polymerase factor sigma-54 [Opitutus terrae]|uniref:RNA polymerase, sigma 54 subunit, RpoN n=1 Tax=Opitutus terrae (strain DSM 11246 / JCM 15787 / PB90-1) TaxID=452637 RepID=B1ZUW1_OPITP|nr:RNA polymerase factor sigma-54 [Opitutus terrae]ACB75931.1 RNA polymerase, sigma 54 subunit, RpoN [Opitutus terrae PB90-1]